VDLSRPIEGYTDTHDAYTLHILRAGGSAWFSPLVSRHNRLYAVFKVRSFQNLAQGCGKSKSFVRTPFTGEQGKPYIPIAKARGFTALVGKRRIAPVQGGKQPF
jgi:hypothetical protein